jgi:hypothetical protein
VPSDGIDSVSPGRIDSATVGGIGPASVPPERIDDAGQLKTIELDMVIDFPEPEKDYAEEHVVVVEDGYAFIAMVGPELQTGNLRSWGHDSGRSEEFGRYDGVQRLEI